MQYRIKTDDPIVDVSLTLDDYCGGVRLPTLRIEGIAVAQLMPDGMLAIRDCISQKDADKLMNLGFKFNTGRDPGTLNKEYKLATIDTSKLKP